MTPLDPVVEPLDLDVDTPAPNVAESGTLLLAWTDGAREDGWAARAVLALARGWREVGRRVFLCDVGLEAPSLHEVAGIPNGEGMSDALRYGTSFRRVAHRIEPNLFIATAGTLAVDAGRLRADARWETFTSGFVEAGALLILAGPAGGESIELLAGLASETRLLAAPGEGVPGPLAAHVSTVMHRTDRPEPMEADDRAVATSLEWDEPEGSPSLHAEEEEVAVWTPGELDPPAFADDAGEDEPILLEDLAPDDPAGDAIEVDDPSIGGTAELGEVGRDPLLSGDPLSAAEVAPVADAVDASTDAEEEVLGIADLAPDAPDPLAADGGLEWVEPEPDAPAAADSPEARSDAAEAEGSEDVPADDEPAPAPAIDGPVVAPGPEPEARRGSGRTLVLLLLLVIVATAAAASFGVIEIPGFPTASADASEPVAADAPAAVAPAAEGSEAPTSEPAEPTVGVAAYVVALAAYGNATDANEARAEWEGRIDAAGVQFILAPIEVDDRPFFRLLAGPTEDAEGASALVERLAEATGADGSQWIVRETRLAFLLGETRGREAADQRVSVLESLGIPAHVLQVPYSDGSKLFRVYAGAYASEAEGEYLRSLLAAQDITNAELTERLGAVGG